MKRFFTKGLFAVLPIVLTAAVLYLVVGFLYNNVGVPIGEAVKWAMARFAGEDPLAPSDHWAWLFRWGAPVLGFCEVDDFTDGEVAPEAELGGCAEGAVERAADLR